MRYPLFTRTKGGRHWQGLDISIANISANGYIYDDKILEIYRRNIEPIPWLL